MNESKKRTILGQCRKTIYKAQAERKMTDWLSDWLKNTTAAATTANSDNVLYWKVHNTTVKKQKKKIKKRTTHLKIEKDKTKKEEKPVIIIIIIIIHCFIHFSRLVEPFACLMATLLLLLPELTYYYSLVIH